jgi:predicted RND superfamily exporter protein
VLRALAALLVRKSVAWATVVVVVLASVFFGARSASVERDDDLLAFLPKENPDIKAFYEVNRLFGSLNVALVGVDAGDALNPEFLAKLRATTKKLNETKGVDYALSLTNMEDFTPDPVKGGIGIDYLVPPNVPTTPEGLAALREKVMSRDNAVGNVISADGKAALIYCFLAGTDPKAGAASIRAVVEEQLPGYNKYWGGAPFIQTYIFGVTEADLRRLTPWACAVILLISIWAFRDTVGTILALYTTVVGIVTALGTMSLFHVKTNLVLGSMPVILFALGSAYPIHILTRYYAVVKEMGRDRAIAHAIVYLGPTVIASGLITAGGLVSFMAMDMAPIRTFGLFTAIGVMTTLILSVTFVPAVIRIFDLKARLSLDNHTSKGMVWFTTTMAENRKVAGAALAAIALAGAVFVGRIDSRIDNSSFYSKQSQPAQAERFMREYFGGSQFFQIHVEGDMNDPGVLREIRTVADRVRVLPHVSSVSHVAMVVAKINEAMEGDERVPDTGAKVKLLYGFLAGQKAVAQLVTDDRAHALLNVKVDTDRAAELETVLADVERVLKDVPSHYAVVPLDGPRRTEGEKRVRAMVLDRIDALAAQFGVPMGPEQTDLVTRGIVARTGAEGASDKAAAEAAILAYLRSEEFTGDLPKSPEDAPRRVAAALAGLGAKASKEAIQKAIAGAIDKPADDAAVLDLASVVKKPVAEILRRQSALADAKRLAADAKLAVPAEGKGQRFLAALGAAIMDLDVTHVVLAEPASQATLTSKVTGQPVLNRGLSQSVDHNQLWSFCLAMGLVFVIVLVLYKSFWSALLSMAPVSLTLLIVYGGMGLLGVHLDIGTSMLASLTTGAGVDYAVHLLAAWKAPPGDPDKPATPAELRKAATYSAFLVGRAIWTNALMVAGGFLVLTMGEARPLQNVGGLTAAAMIVAGLATFAAIPVFARKRCYDERPRITEILPSSDVAEGQLAPGHSPSMLRGSS